jgi:hypothetical protein
MALQNWVIQRLTKQMRSGKNPSISTRRDTALIAALCVAPAKGTPRKWPENSLIIEGREVLLWDMAIEEPCFVVSLRFWHAYPQGPFGRGGSSALPTATVSNAGGLGSYGANYQGPAAIIKIAADIRKHTDKPFGLSLSVFSNQDQACQANKRNH